jgi:2-amino-4-hydroxy-6-hydroxymethyldihydropteridine diphosphokinase
MATACFALGSNLGDRRDNLDRALRLLRQRPDVAVERVSSYHETEPVGGPAGQGRYLNAAAVVRTDLPPLDLLRLLLDVEQQLGRVRGERFGPRTIDLDLLLYDDVVAGRRTTLPHPRMHERAFVLVPLAEVAPRAVHPVIGSTCAICSCDCVGATVVSCGTAGGGDRLNQRHRSGDRAGVRRRRADVIVHGRRSADAASAWRRRFRNAACSAFLLADLRDMQQCAG